MSIFDHPETEQKAETRHPVCVAFEQLLDQILADQAAGNSYVFREFKAEWGESCATSVMQAAGLRKLRLEHVNMRERVEKLVHATNGNGPEQPERGADKVVRPKIPGAGDGP